MINGEFTMDEKYIYKNDEIEILMEDLVGYYATEKQRVKTLGIPVPESFTISSKVFEEYKTTKSISEVIKQQIWNNIAILEQKTNKKIAVGTPPLLLKILVHRCDENSNALYSVSNVGINKEFIKSTKNSLWAFDCYANFLLKYVEFADETGNNEEYNAKISNYFRDIGKYEESEMPNARFVINKEIVRDLTSYHKKKTNLNYI